MLRYVPTDDGVDGIGEPEGVFLPCSFWMVEALALAGRTDEARALFERLLVIANDVGLYAEEYDPSIPPAARQLPPGLHAPRAGRGRAHTLEPEKFAIDAVARRRPAPRPADVRSATPWRWSRTW